MGEDATQTQMVVLAVGTLAVGAAVSTMAWFQSSNDEKWRSTMERVVPSIVALQINRPTPFDTEKTGPSAASGFVVDADRGIILTNRHVVGTGPLTARAIFHNNEEVPVTPLYRDPVHDFAFLRYDPAQLRHAAVERAIPLRPDKAHMGMDIRVVGNDGGEKLAIASGTLARLDRPAPSYGKHTYGDFNTFYFQASSGTSGGSSGSPVLDLDGDAVALNAAGKLLTSAGFYLPLDRVRRAFELLLSGSPVPRGTLNVTFNHRPFDAVRRLGLAPATEDWVRAQLPAETGMLVVGEKILELRPSDVLIGVDGKLITRFVELEQTLDDKVGQEVLVEVERVGRRLKYTMQVEDLHALIPKEFISIGDTTVNPLSLHVSRSATVQDLPPQTPYVAYAGYMLRNAGIGVGSVLMKIDGHDIPDIAYLKRYFEKCHDKQRVLIEYINLRDVNTSPKTAAVTVDRKWFPFKHCSRPPSNVGPWSCQDIETKAERFQRSSASSSTVSTQLMPGKNSVEKKLAPSLVSVKFTRPYKIDGCGCHSFYGTGVVVDTVKGFVVVDRNTVTDYMGDVTISIGNKAKVPGKVVYVHPVHNFAVIQYDPTHAGVASLASIQISRKSASVDAGQRVWLVGIRNFTNSRPAELASSETKISRKDWVQFPVPSPPRYQQCNAELLLLQAGSPISDGVISTPRGQVLALWANSPGKSPGGIPFNIVMESVEALIQGHVPIYYALGVDLEPISIAAARDIGLPEALGVALEKHNPARQIVFQVERRWGDTMANSKLKRGDLIIAIDGRHVTSYREIELATQSAQVRVTVLRSGREHEILLDTVALQEVHADTDEVLFWQGLTMQAPPFAVASQRELSRHCAVYVTERRKGSPASRSGPPPTSRVIEVNDEQVETLSDMKRIITGLQHTASAEHVRIRYLNLAGREYMTTLELDRCFWPSFVLKRDAAGSGEWANQKIQ